MNKQEEKKSSSVAIVILGLLVCVVGILIGYVISAASKDIENNKQTNELSSPALSTTTSPAPKLTKTPVVPESGEIFIGSVTEGYESYLTVSSASNVDSFIVLEYSYRPEYGSFTSVLSRFLNGYYTFYIRANDDIEVTVPSGSAKLYYASGETWYGTDLKFGEDTVYYASDDVFDFENYTYDISLYPVSDGDMYTYEINSDDFPT